MYFGLSGHHQELHETSFNFFDTHLEVPLINYEQEVH